MRRGDALFLELIHAARGAAAAAILAGTDHGCLSWGGCWFGSVCPPTGGKTAGERARRPNRQREGGSHGHWAGGGSRVLFKHWAQAKEASGENHPFYR